MVGDVPGLPVGIFICLGCDRGGSLLWAVPVPVRMDGRLQKPVFPVWSGDGWLRAVWLPHRKLLRTECLRPAFILRRELFPLCCKLFSL